MGRCILVPRRAKRLRPALVYALYVYVLVLKLLVSFSKIEHS